MKGGVKTKHISENRMALFNIASTAIIAGINFITIPIFTRLLDTDGYGIVNIYIAWVQIFTILVGLKADGSIGSAKANLPEEEQDSYHLSILVMSLIPFGIALVVILILIEPMSDLLNMEPPLVFCMVLQSYGAFIIALFGMRFIFKKQASSNFAMSVGLCVATTLLSIALIMIVHNGHNSYMGRIFGLTLPNVLIGVGLFAFLAFRSKAAINVKYWGFCLGLSLPLVFHGLSQILLAQTGKIAVQNFVGDSMAGVYSLAVVIVSLLGAIYSALNNAFVPFMYDDLAGKTSEDMKNSHFRNYFVSFTLGTCAFALMSPEILKLMSTEAYWEATAVLPPLVVGQYCVFLYSFPVNYEFYRMSTKSVAIGTVLAAALNLGLCLLLVPQYGMMGAALATMASYVGLFTFHFLIARYVLGDRNYPVFYYVAGLVVVAMLCIACYPLGDFVTIRWLMGAVALAMVGMRIYKTRSVF